MKFLYSKLAFVIVFLFTSSGLSGQTVINVNEKLMGKDFGSHMSFFVDETRHLSIQDILEKEGADQFAPLNMDSPRFGFTNATIWLEMLLENTSDEAVLVYIESRYSLLDYINLYSVSQDQKYSVQELGDKAPYHNRLVQDRHSVFAVEVAPGINKYYVEVFSAGSINVPLHFWTPSEFYKNSKFEYMIAGLVIGFLSVMLFYNLFLAISFGSKTYLFYVIYIMCFISYQLGILGIGKELSANYSWQNFVQNNGILLSIQGANIFACLFTVYFLDLKQRMLGLWRIFVGISGFNVLILFLVLLAGYNASAKLVNVLSLVTALLLITVGLVNIIKGYRPAIYFTLAWVWILVGNVALALSIAGIIPFGFFSTWGQSLGGAVEVVLLSLALGDRVNYIRSMHENKIQTLNKELQHHIEDIEEIVQEKTRDIKSIMKNIKQGIFTIHSSENEEIVAEIGDDYSQYLSELIGEEDISRQSVMELIFDKSDLGSDAKNRILEVVRATLNEDEINFYANNQNLATEFRLVDQLGEEKIVEIDWSPVINESDDTVDKILVTLRDVTNLRQLQAEARLQQEELEYIAEILNVDTKKFNKLLDIAYQYIEENNRLIARSKGRNNEILKILFINMHTLKGMARSYNLLKMTDVIHQVEKYYALLQKEPDQSWDKGKLEADMERATEIFDKYNSINISKLNRGSEKNKISLEKSFISQKMNLLDKLDTSVLSLEDQEIIKETKKSFSSIFYQNSDKVFSEIFSNIETLSKDLGKEKPTIHVKNPGYSLSEEGADILQNVFTHIIRNSIDHGIETGTERIAKGKLPEGQISIELSQVENEFLEIRYADDGVGLNIKKLRQLAEERSILTHDQLSQPQAVAYTIFADGLSTAPSVTEISGRGVGMGAIKQYIEQAGGSFRLYFKEEPTLESSGLPFGIVMALPKKYYHVSSEAQVA
ncbi:MAG: 7TM diverse intracellular signaling domain-containing protein [Oligoflexus sp.]